jgi:hypothetical protein
MFCANNRRSIAELLSKALEAGLGVSENEAGVEGSSPEEYDTVLIGE